MNVCVCIFVSEFLCVYMHDTFVCVCKVNGRNLGFAAAIYT